MKLTSDYQSLENLLVEGLDTNRKSRLKATELFRRVNPTLPMPPVNLTELELRPESRQFMTRTLEQS